MRLKKIFSIILFSLLCSGDLSAAWIGDSAPVFDLPALDGKSFGINDAKGKIILINFWATWCGPCKIELPELHRLAQEYKDTLIVLAINLDKKKENVVRFLEKYPVDLRILHDPQSKVVAQYGARAMPTSFIVDQKGLVKFIHLGFSEKDPLVWRKEIDSLK